MAIIRRRNGTAMLEYEGTLCGRDLRGKDLAQAVFHGMDLSHANLSGADLSGADFDGADLTGADLTGANLSDANLSWAILRSALLEQCSLCRAHCRGASFVECSANFADFTEANLWDADFTRAIAEGARFEAAFMMGAHLNQGDFYKGWFAEAVMFRTHAQNARFGGADFPSALCIECDFSGAYLGLDNLGGAGSLKHADLTRAKLLGTDLDGVDLSGTTLKNAEYSASTRFPAAFDIGLHEMKLVDRKEDGHGID